MPVYNPFFKLSARDSVMTLAKATGANAGGHEVAAYGYDATGVKIANSWGTGWGNAGWATLSWDFVGAYVFEASTPGTFAASTVPAPAQTARTLAVAAGTKVAAATGGTVVVTSSGFGTTNADVAAGRLAVTVNRARAKATWISDGALAVAVPAGTPGAKASIAVSRSGTAWAPVSVPYVATITAMSVTSGPSSGGTVTTLTGRGFTGASTWAVTRADGTLLVALPVVTSLDRAQAGVVVVNDTSAKVKLPPAPSGFLPVVVTFTPDQKVYPGAASAPTAAAVFTYSDLG
jgi:hypothetical protein